MTPETENRHLTKEEATAFFSEFYYGEHHLPRSGVKDWGEGWCVHHDQGDLATFDSSDLTRLVLMGHDKCIRVSVQPHAFKTLRIAIWKRQPEGSLSKRHPTIEQAIEKYRQQSQ